MEFMPLIERDRRVVLGVHDDRKARDLTSQAPAKSIQQQKCSDHLAALFRIDGQTAEQRGRGDELRAAVQKPTTVAAG